MNKFISKIIIISAILLPFLTHAYVNPGQPTGFVNDFAGMISSADKQIIEEKLSNFQKQTGNEISVVTIQNLGGDTIENFAVNLFKDWGIGKTREDNGALLLVSRDDREMRIEVGYGLEPVLTDASSFLIIRDIITPSFKSGNYAKGISDGVDKMISVIGGERISESTISKIFGGNFNFGDYFFLILFIPVWLASILARSKSWWAGGVIGGILGVAVSIFFGFIYFGLISIAVLIPVGLLFDYFVSKKFADSKNSGTKPPWWIGGGGFGGGGHGGFGGGFGGFGGGMSGGGGASGRW